MRKEGREGSKGRGKQDGEYKKKVNFIRLITLSLIRASIWKLKKYSTENKKNYTLRRNNEHRSHLLENTTFYIRVRLKAFPRFSWEKMLHPIYISYFQIRKRNGKKFVLRWKKNKKTFRQISRLYSYRKIPSHSSS